MQLTAALHGYFISLYQKQRFNSELQNVLLQVLCVCDFFPPSIFSFLFFLNPPIAYVLKENASPLDKKQCCDTNSRELSSLRLHGISGGRKCSS